MAVGVSRHGSVLLTASGAIGIAGKPKIIYGFHVIAAGASAPVVVIKDNGTSGTIFIQETGTAGAAKGTSFDYGEGFYFPDDAFYTADGNQTSVLFSYDEYLGC